MVRARLGPQWTRTRATTSGVLIVVIVARSSIGLRRLFRSETVSCPKSGTQLCWRFQFGHSGWPTIHGSRAPTMGVNGRRYSVPDGIRAHVKTHRRGLFGHSSLFQRRGGGMMFWASPQSKHTADRSLWIHRESFNRLTGAQVSHGTAKGGPRLEDVGTPDVPSHSPRRRKWVAEDRPVRDPSSMQALMQRNMK